MKIETQIKQLLPWMIKHRRALHKIPEVCYKEFKTSEYLKNVLKELNLPFQTVGTGIIINIKGSKPLKTIGFRADIDALPIMEESAIDYKSTHNGFMHACGHDGHMAMLLGFCKYLTKNPPKNNVVLVFQPAEEGGLGAAAMINSGLIEADIFYALHIHPFLETGTFASRVGEMMAGGDMFEVIFGGLSRHAQLHDGKQDAILACVKFIDEAEKLNNPDFIFHVGKIEGGTAPNIVAETVKIRGTMRFYNMQMREDAHKRLLDIARDVEKDNVGNVDVKIHEKFYPPVINTATAVNRISKLDGFVESKKYFGSEDFSLFINKYSGAFIRLGAKTDGKYPLHSNKFNFDENALIFGVQIFKELL